MIIKKTRLINKEFTYDDNFTIMNYKEYVQSGKPDNTIITDLPYRFGITTSNMSESFNNTIDFLRDKSWYDIIDGYISMIIKKNGNEHERLMNADPNEVLSNVKEEMKAMWEKTGGYDYYILRPDGM